MGKISFLITCSFFLFSKLHSQQNYTNDKLSFSYSGELVDTTFIIQEIENQFMTIDYLIFQDQSCDLLLTVASPNFKITNKEVLCGNFNFKERKSNPNAVYGDNVFDVIGGYNFEDKEKKIYVLANPVNISTNKVFIFTFIIDSSYETCNKVRTKWINEILSSVEISEK